MRLTRITLVLISLIIAFGFYRLADFLLKDLEAQTFQASEETMVDTAHLLASFLEIRLREEGSFHSLKSLFGQARRHEFRAKIHRQTKTGLGMDAYLTDAKGTVILDTDGGRREGMDFSEYNDVFRTLRGKYGTRSTRETPEDPSSSVLHVAAPVKDPSGKIIGALTVRKHQADLVPFIQQRRKSILQAITLIGVGILALIAAVFIWAYRPISKLTGYARAITRGKRLPAPEVGAGREASTLRDALVQMREALEGRRYAEKYVQALTHELKSPLAAIKGAAELLMEGLPPEDRQRFLRNIQTETARSETLISRLLSLAALESRSHLEHPDTLRLRDLAREALGHCRPLAENKNISFREDLPETLSVRGDASVLVSAIACLLENAIDFSPPGKTIAISARKKDGNACLSISDQGSGLPGFALKRAFERFFSHREGRENVTRKGSGLGLSFVREAAKLHNGSASIENLPGEGAKVSLILPASGDMTREE